MSLLTEQEIEDLYYTELDRRELSFARAIEAKVIEKIKARRPVAHLYFNEHGTPRVDQQYLPSEDSFPVYRLPEGD